MSGWKADSDVDPALADLALLCLLPPDARRIVVAAFEPVSYAFGAVIVREGDEADALYVIASGSARVVKATDAGDEITLNVLGRGDVLGELALLDGGTRTATARASSPVEAWRLDRAVFDALMRAQPLIRECVELSARAHPLRTFLRVRSGFAALGAEALTALLRDLHAVTVTAGEVVVREGDAGGEMFVVRAGRLRASTGSGAARKDVGYMRAGDFFGELSTLTAVPRAATVTALTDCELLALRADRVRALAATHRELRELFDDHRRRYRDERAAVPLDFAEEAAAPAPATADGRAPQAAEERLEVVADSDWGAGFERPKRRIRRFPHVWQVDEMDCGAASLAMIARHFGRAVSASHIRGLVFTSVDGTSLTALARGAERLGLAARPVKASKSRLDELPLPAIVHWKGNHWFVLYDVGDRNVRVADPALGLRRIAREEFERLWSGYAVLLAPTARFDDAPEQESSARWLLDFLRPHRRVLLGALVLALVAAGLQMLLPVMSQVVVDEAIARRDRGLLTVLALGMLALLVVAIAAQVLQRLLLARSAVRIDGEALDFLTGRMLALPVSYFLTRKTGDVQRRLDGLRQVRMFAVEQGLLALSAATQLFVAVVLMFVYSWVLALVYLATVPVYAALMRVSRRRLRPIFDSLEESFGDYQSRQIDAVKGIETVKAMGAEDSLRALMLKQFRELSQRLFRADLTIMLNEAAIQAVSLLSFALFLWIAALEVLAGRLSIGELVSFNALVLLANGPILTLLSLWDELQRAQVQLHRLNDIVEQEPEQGTDRSALRPVPTLAGEVELRAVGFHYPGAVPTAILDDVSLKVAAGTTVAIVGRSGSGKTTLVKCLAGLLVPTAGTILFDGVDMVALDHRQLRRQIGFVLQDNHLFDDTIARNIAFGSVAEPDMRQVEWAATLANAHEFVRRLPLGYDTRVGETGLRLSAGQRQRVAIARAVYARPPILVLDEATSALDTESERAVKQNLDALLADRTSFVIAHRLSTVRDADLIVVVEQGRLVERGTHEELLARGGLYAYLAGQQLAE